MRRRCVYTAPWVLALFGVLSGTFPAVAADLTLKTADAAPPADVPADFKSLLDTKAVQLFDGDKPVYEFWFRKDVPLQAKPAAGKSGLDSLKEITFLGVVQVFSRQKDFRNDDIEKGLYSMRLGLLPSDGNHLGTSPYPYMAVLVPVKYDKTTDDIKSHDALAEMSSKDTYAEHPNVLSMQPLPEKDVQGNFPRLAEGGDNWKFLYLKLPAKAENGDSANLTFGLVYEGHGKL